MKTSVTLRTARYLIRTVASRWRDHYPRRHVDVADRLAALDPEAATAEDVRAIVEPRDAGSHWTAWGCDGCHKRTEEVAEIGEGRDDGRGVRLCAACAGAAHRAFDSHDQDVPLSVDPVTDWIQTHLHEYHAHRGRRIAIHPQRGIVASGATPEEVWQEVCRQGLERDVYLDVVPDDRVTEVKRTVVAFNPMEPDSSIEFYDLDGEPVDCVEAILRVMCGWYGEGEVVAVIREAEWKESARVVPWWAHLHMYMDKLVTSPSDEAEQLARWEGDAEMTAHVLEEQAEERLAREARLATFLQLPDDFVDRFVARLEAAVLRRDRAPYIRDVERLAAIRAAVAAHRAARK